MKKMDAKISGFIFFIFTLLSFSTITSAQELNFPSGLILNLDFYHIQNGLIPNKTSYPLYVPTGQLTVATVSKNTKVLQIKPGEGFSIPHSFLLDPTTNEWVVTLRVFIQTDGLILSQGNRKSGYVIYVKEGAIHAIVRTPSDTSYLQERASTGITNYKNRWVTIDLQLLKDRAVLSLNRTHVAEIPLKVPMVGKNFQIQIGQHKKIPVPLKDYPNASTNGFSGAIRSLKMLRQ